MRADIPESISDLVHALEHGLLRDAAGRAAATVVRAGLDDPFSRGLIRNRIRRHEIAKALDGPFDPPRSRQGDLVFGLNARGRPVLSFLQYLNAHSLTLGGSGSGKTTKSKVLAVQIARLIPGLWLFDLRKGTEFAVLAPLLAAFGIDLIVLDARSVRINPLQVPFAVAPDAWASSIADMMVGSLGLPPRAAKILHTHVALLYRRFNVVAGSRRYPTLFDLREAVATDTDANSPAREAILDSLDRVLISLGPDVLAWRRGWSTRDLARRKIVFQFGGIAEADQDLLLNTLLLSEFSSRVAQGLSNVPMDLWISCDEAARLVSASASSTAIAGMLGLVRGTGIGVDLSVQTANLSPSVLSNTATKFIGRCGSATDYDLMASAMGLTPDQGRWMRLNLRPGVFVCQLGEGEWRRPFVLQVPPMRSATLPRPEPHLGDLSLLPVSRRNG